MMHMRFRTLATCVATGVGFSASASVASPSKDISPIYLDCSFENVAYLREGRIKITVDDLLIWQVSSSSKKWKSFSTQMNSPDGCVEAVHCRVETNGDAVIYTLAGNTYGLFIDGRLNLTLSDGELLLSTTTANPNNGKTVSEKTATGHCVKSQNPEMDRGR